MPTVNRRLQRFSNNTKWLGRFGYEASAVFRFEGIIADVLPAFAAGVLQKLF